MYLPACFANFFGSILRFQQFNPLVSSSGLSSHLLFYFSHRWRCLCTLAEERRQRQVQNRKLTKANMNITKNPITHHLNAKSRTVTWRKISKWQLDNPYIHDGYRPAKSDYKAIFNSLTYLHNESCNVYTHLGGALLLPLVAFSTRFYLADTRFHHVSSMDYTIFGLYFCCAEICLVLSTLYHVLQSHSHQVEQFWHGMDLLGIVIVTMGTFSSGIYYVFFCEANLQKLHWLIVSLRATVIICPISWRSSQVSEQAKPSSRSCSRGQLPVLSP